MARVDPVPARDWPASMRDALAALVPPEVRHPRPSQPGRPKGLNILGTFAHLLTGELDVEQLLDAIFTIGAYETLAFMERSLGLELDDDLIERP